MGQSIICQDGSIILQKNTNMWRNYEDQYTSNEQKRVLLAINTCPPYTCTLENKHTRTRTHHTADDDNTTDKERVKVDRKTNRKGT